MLPGILRRRFPVGRPVWVKFGEEQKAGVVVVNDGRTVVVNVGGYLAPRHVYVHESVASRDLRVRDTSWK